MSKETKIYQSNGKLLITGEYAVLDGANSLAIPTKYGQNLEITPNDSNIITWKSYNELNTIWYEDEFLIENSLDALIIRAKTNNEISERLIQILHSIMSLNPEFLHLDQGYDVKTHQDFNRLWGLGTSSTLINNMADWGNVDAYKLLEKTFGGSGYDIACAQNNSAITFQLQKDKTPIVETVDFQPQFKQHLYFVYLNQKQNSRDGIAAYKKLGNLNPEIIIKINTITKKLISSESLSEFNSLIELHETIISSLIQQEPIKLRLFRDFNGAIKSLGAWGGDFVLVTSAQDPTPYFKSKGLDIVIPYDHMIL
ncbi:GYDIA family GHMP kinase [uncultured Winogradskyella sp.]|uniref:GYDIA family GHMP kinase n=1 Tax=uncultured Winogradskyella sp. TaxID=395353 RepID=UPI002614E8A3|nr:GYDIA family GHMP kinase [uncultured Winogradskyella sp.]